MGSAEANNAEGAQESVRNRAGLPLFIDPRDTWLPFVGVWCYVASQAYQIPLLAIGPSWAVWPGLSDLAVGLMLVSYVLGRRHLSILSPENRGIYRALLIVCGACAAAFGVASLPAVMGSPSSAPPSSFGIFQIYRLAQFLLVFRVAAGLPVTRRRLTALSAATDVALVVASLGVVGTYTGVLPTRLLAHNLPADLATAGPWAYLARGQFHDVGTIGYNHSYTSVQLLMLVGLSMALRPRRSPAVFVAFFALAAIGVFLTASRAGMAAALFLLVAYLLRRPALLVAALAGFILLFFGLSGSISEAVPGVRSTFDRQLTLGHPLDPENLSGRADIWEDSLAFMSEDSLRWAVGAGPGSVPQTVGNAHMLYLHIVMEGGVIGLVLFGFAVYRILLSLRRSETGSKPLFLTTLALLASAATQETLYPVPSMGHFLGFFFCSIALGLAINSNRPAWERSAGRGHVEVA